MCNQEGEARKVLNQMLSKRLVDLAVITPDSSLTHEPNEDSYGLSLASQIAAR